MSTRRFPAQEECPRLSFEGSKGGALQNPKESNMRSTALSLATLALGAALAAAPAFAQTPSPGRLANDGGLVNTQSSDNAQKLGVQYGTDQANSPAANPRSASRSRRGAASAAGDVYGSSSEGPYYNFAPGFGFGPQAGPMDQDTAACSARFRSFDPSSGTYLGFDGARHSCP
jgi:hypothetical protein